MQYCYKLTVIINYKNITQNNSNSNPSSNNKFNLQINLNKIKSSSKYKNK